MLACWDERIASTTPLEDGDAAEDGHDAGDQSDFTKTKWFKETAQKRSKLGIQDRSIKPYTSRPEVHLRGLPRQIAEPNFQNETLDVRVAEVLTSCGLAMDTPRHLWPTIVTDIRASVFRQLSLGRFTMVGNSVPFLHDLDRVHVVWEIVRHFGHGSDVRIEDLHIGFPELEPFGVVNSVAATKKRQPPKAVVPPGQGAEVAPGPKRRKARQPKQRANSAVQPFRTKCNDLMSNSMDLADFSVLAYPVFLASNRIWEHALRFPEPKERLTPRNAICFDCEYSPNMLPHDFKARVEATMGSHATKDAEADSPHQSDED